MKSKEILRCICFVILGYFIAMIFNRMCSCRNINGFNVGGTLVPPDTPVRDPDTCRSNNLSLEGFPDITEKCCKDWQNNNYKNCEDIDPEYCNACDRGVNSACRAESDCISDGRALAQDVQSRTQHAGGSCESLKNTFYGIDAFIDCDSIYVKPSPQENIKCKSNLKCVDTPV